MSRELQLAERLKALGDPVRLRILNRLPHSPNCEHGNNVSQLAEELGVSQPTVSHHLRVLRMAGLIEYRKMCRDVFYWINPDVAKEVVELLRLVFGPLPRDEKEMPGDASRGPTAGEQWEPDQTT